MESITGVRDERRATKMGRVTSMPGLALLSLAPAQPLGLVHAVTYRYRTRSESITGVRDERRATKMGRVTSMPGLALLSLAPAQPLGLVDAVTYGYRMHRSEERRVGKEWSSRWS